MNSISFLKNYQSLDLYNSIQKNPFKYRFNHIEWGFQHVYFSTQEVKFGLSQNPITNIKFYFENGSELKFCQALDQNLTVKKESETTIV